MKSINERVAKAIYDKFFENLIGCTEPPYNELPQEHKERLEDSIRAGLQEFKNIIVERQLDSANDVLRIINKEMM